MKATTRETKTLDIECDAGDAPVTGVVADANGGHVGVTVEPVPGHECDSPRRGVVHCATAAQAYALARAATALGDFLKEQEAQHIISTACGGKT